MAGEIGALLGLPPSNLSFHLKTLAQAQLVSAEQEGRFQRYRANMPLMLDLIGYLTAECCAGHRDQCALPGAVSMTATPPGQIASTPTPRRLKA